MKILIYCPTFDNIGGLENVVSILAHGFVSEGYEVKIVAQTLETVPKTLPFEVIRKPNPLQLLNLVQWCNFYVQANISLKGIWPLLLIRKPLLVTHQSWYQRLDETIGWQDRLKLLVTRFAINISASKSIATHLPVPSTVIPNPYREDVFNLIPEVPRTKELAFLGRLVSDKGADLLLEALAQIKLLGLTPKLTIIGTGPEETLLRQQAKDLGLESQVTFVGAKFERELAELLNAHNILVVPSRWAEPFGIVALEGIACGCVIIGSDRGGLPEAIGPCGVTFPNGDSQALAQILVKFLQTPNLLNSYRELAASHLSCHTAIAVTKAYLQVIENYQK